jgi:hypothetical protein
MANEQNLLKKEDRTASERRESARNAGIASGEARRRKRDLRLAMEMLLEKDITDSSGKTVSGAEAIALKQFQKALKGDTRAFEMIRDTAGQKPIDKTVQANIDTEYLESVEYISKLFSED